jgi:type II secretory pathway pseudopilin PulG
MSMSQKSTRRDEGFSLVEVLFAAALLLIIAVGILPLFTQAMVNNVAGRNSTMAANHGRSEVESMVQLPFNDPRIQVTAGTETTWTEWWTEGDADRVGDTAEGWFDVEPVAGVWWRRDLRVRQYSVADLETLGNLQEFDSPLAAGTEPGFVHLREIEVLINGTAPGADVSSLGQKRDILLRTMTAY